MPVVEKSPDVIELSLDDGSSDDDIQIQEVRALSSEFAEGGRRRRPSVIARQRRRIERRRQRGEDDDDVRIVDERPLLRPTPTPQPQAELNPFRIHINRIHQLHANRSSAFHALTGGGLLLHDLRQLLSSLPSFSDSDIMPLIMARIERESEGALDARMEKERAYNVKTHQEKQLVVATEVPGYTNTLLPAHPVGCEVCGVSLGAGVTDDFAEDPRYGQQWEKYQKQYRVPAPWFCVLSLTATDRELLKRVFNAKCGHVFCGRCVKNIGSAPKVGRKRRQIDMSHPKVYSPQKCPQCQASLRRKFNEIFL